MKNRPFSWMLAACLLTSTAYSESFHIEIPLRDGYQRYLQRAIDYKYREYKFCPTLARAQKGLCGVQEISGDGRLVYGMIGTYSLADQRIIKGTAGPVSEHGMYGLNAPLTMASGTDEMFSIVKFPDNAYAGAELPRPTVVQDSGELPEDAAFVVARSLAHDGSFVVGEYRYTGKARLAIKRNADGSIDPAYAGGRKSLTISNAFLWSEVTGYRFFPRPAGWRRDGHYSAFGISKDGNTVLATIYDNKPPWANQRPVIIDRRNNSATALDHVLTVDNTSTEAKLISGDGNTVVGRAIAKYDSEVFRWTRTAGYQSMEIPQGSGGWDLEDLTYDGSLVVGTASLPSPDSPYGRIGLIWENGKFHRIGDYLTARGLDLKGWDLTTVNAISDDGLVIGGQADGKFIKGVPWFAWLGEGRLAFPSPSADISYEQTRDWKITFGQAMADASATRDRTAAAGITAAADEQTATPLAVANERQSNDAAGSNITTRIEQAPAAASEQTMARVETPKPAPPPAVSSAAEKPKSYVGCWHWSNGLKIKINEDGTAANGFIPAPWKAISDSEFEIDWPDITGKISLSADGQSLKGLDSLGQRSTAQRIDGAPGSFVGTWRWDNGGIVNITADGAMLAGAFRGSWSGAGRNYRIVWPLLDRINVAADGKTLIGQNQFGGFSATRGSGCR